MSTEIDRFERIVANEKSTATAPFRKAERAARGAKTSHAVAHTARGLPRTRPETLAQNLT